MSPAFNLQTCARPNILALEPYRCARDDYKDDGTHVLLDANENAYGPPFAAAANDAKTTTETTAATTTTPSSSALAAAADAAGFDLLGLHRYPDPHQVDLKQQLCALRTSRAHAARPVLTPDHLFVGVGSDEAIDALLRCFCVPGRDRILVCPPTYGMYSVAAQVNDVGLVRVPLTPAPAFGVDVPAVHAALTAAVAAPDYDVKLVYLCSPGNPTGRLLARDDIAAVLRHPTWNGVVVVDEAYVDFAGDGDGNNNRDASLAEWVADWPNLVVLQTLSKAFGLAGIRLGAAFCAPPRARLCAALPAIPGVGRLRGGLDSNFLLYEMLNADDAPDNATALAVYTRLAEQQGVVVRFRGKEHGCLGCLRITVGTEDENTRFLAALAATLAEVRGTATATVKTRVNTAAADAASRVVD
ncbi:histidinol-phosphate aminotransferase [Niveomyces insectorum RCEF 264]|uniref:histidinol-phosphate transaminase n=1 Tax=Niveomyces insectorum RCEF 264 TaxID=1081102 RepID=A0A167N2H2_9HYPO|nr:histidinol-phosphate aminotransferase [Niveomyces insectorum RCEF 264]